MCPWLEYTTTKYSKQSKKWFFVEDVDWPVWPSQETATKIFRLGLGAIDVKRIGKTMEVSFKEELTGVVNVRQTCKMVKMEEVQTYDSK